MINNLAHLIQYKLVYLASAYTRRTDKQAAVREACEAATAMMRVGVKVFSPIAHSHTVAQFGGLDPLDGAFWAAQDLPLQDAAGAVVVLKSEGWAESDGISAEIAHAALMGQPVYGLEPNTLALTKWGFG